ncbi:DNA polymerase/3'-5' exonuclease PolX [Rhodohalobacter sp. SW132]|uniref:DNA polymerase/3'-5' exonuclease PolX n=1 Tax=Rhodohalobacter sp. SW132 TaxID=2293433 RepID=UPI000E22D959|nr:DNA polymerase/3'-5' exonuclease PolX [Rhodohalobacter sp. SW132]REL23983.1 DNA polymerase/3'-5' exonuclease PolX [Rhodohalobacter sp. SW132]
MTNQDVAKKLRDVYQLMQLAGENRFRAIAFDRAAQTIEGLNEEVQSHIDNGTLTDIKGIGKSIAEDIEALSKTGTMPVLEDLKERVPKGLVEWLNISGLGPKNIVKIHQTLGITEVAELKEACQSGAVADLPGLGKKSAEKIIKSIEYLEKFGERCRIDQALAVAEPMLEFIQGIDGVLKCEIAGSLRRSAETIGDVDILAAANTDDASEIFEQFVNHNLVVEILGRGDTKSSVRTENGRQVDLRIVSEKEYPAALMYFTGSKEHNIVMRQRARERGMALNEYGLFKLNEEKETDFDQPVETGSESDIYKKLDLHFVPPEHREDRGEFEYYVENDEMNLLKEDQIKGVVHAHSTYSDGKYSIKQMADACIKRGYEYLTITDHSRAAAYAGGLTIDRVKQQWDEIDQLNEEYSKKDFRIFKGIESDILNDGSLDYPDEILEGFDIVIASVHSGLEMDHEKMMTRFENAIKNPYTHMIGHPTGRLLLKREESKLDLNRLIELATEHNTAIEINANPRRLDLDWRYGNKAKETGLLTSINPDAHTTEGIDNIRYGVMIARKAKFDPERVLNTKSADEFAKWLSKG